jgi:NAD(P)-dependent dehydrogenase (short-subunit alcohol dehydrogenase family)
LNRVVVLTGAAAGLGLSLSERFIETGDTVYGITKTKKNWKSARKRIVDAERFRLVQADAASESQVRRVLSEIYRKTRRIDVLINNAGYANRPARFEKESLAEFQRNLSSNLVSTFLMCKYTLPFFRKQKGGWIVNVASMAGKRAVPRLAAYSASKFGVVALSQVIAKENTDIALKCVTVCPGGMNTEMRSKLFGTEDAERQQSPDFVAHKIFEIVEGKIPMGSGDDIVIRHGQIAAINPLPGA